MAIMADEVVTSVTPAVTTTPAPSAPITAPVEVSSTETIPSAPTQEVKSPEQVISEPTVLGAEDTPKVEAKVEAKIKADDKSEVKTESKDVKPVEKTEADKKPAEGADKEKAQPEVEKKEESSQSDEPAPLPSYEPLKLPEGVAIDEERVGELNKMFGEFEVKSKASHAEVETLRQQLFDRHITEAQAIAGKIAESYDKFWKDQTKGWYDEFVKDPEIGGNRQETTVRAAREFIRANGGTPEQQAEIRTLMQKTGIGNHPAIIRLFAKANMNLGEGKPIPASKPPVVQATTRKDRFYKK